MLKIDADIEIFPFLSASLEAARSQRQKADADIEISIATSDLFWLLDTAKSSRGIAGNDILRAAQDRAIVAEQRAAATAAKLEEASSRMLAEAKNVLTLLYERGGAQAFEDFLNVRRDDCKASHMRWGGVLYETYSYLEPPRPVSPEETARYLSQWLADYAANMASAEISTAKD